MNANVKVYDIIMLARLRGISKELRNAMGHAAAHGDRELTDQLLYVKMDIDNITYWMEKQQCSDLYKPLASLPLD